MDKLQKFKDELSSIDPSVVDSVNQLDSNLKKSGVDFNAKPLTVEDMYESHPASIERPKITANSSRSMYL